MTALGWSRDLQSWLPGGGGEGLAMQLESPTGPPTASLQAEAPGVLQRIQQAQEKRGPSLHLRHESATTHHG